MDVAQFSYNLYKSSSTRFSPCEVAFGYQPLAPLEVAKQKTDGRCPTAYYYARERQEMLDQTRDSLNKAARRMAKNADRTRRMVEFQVGDKVLLKLTPQIWRRITRKTAHRGLVPRYDGPFKVVKRIGAVAHRLALLDRLKVHPTFHVSFLKPFNEDLLDDRRR